MKCQTCGHRTNSLAAMAEHYRKKHPSKMKRGRIQRIPELSKSGKFCPNCGHKL